MADIDKFSTTQRAYTLRLKNAEDAKDASHEDKSWTETLWKTHEIVNRGAKAFGNWLLTLRGGIGHELADMQDEGRCERRILLALSWLSVESRSGLPQEMEKYEVERNNGGEWKTTEALEVILQSRGVMEVGDWLKDCRYSLSAAIRDDAVWVNRSRAFDAAVKEIGGSLTREEVWDILERFFGGKREYLKPRKISKDAGKKEKEAPKELVIKAGNWLSSRFGEGEGADFKRLAKAYSKIAKWAESACDTRQNTLADLASALEDFAPAPRDLKDILGVISGPGHKSGTRNFLKEIAMMLSEKNFDALRQPLEEKVLGELKEKAEKNAATCEENDDKGRREWSDKILKSIEKTLGYKFTYLQENGPARHKQFAVMLDHAARKVSACHTQIKLAEARRRKCEEDKKKKAEVPKDAKKWLDEYCEERSESSGAIGTYLIRKRAITGWEHIIKAWKGCETEVERIDAARASQEEIDKFGDMRLFEALAADDAICVWQADGKLNAKILQNYVDATKAEFDKSRFKVPAYRHPDPLLHPVFCDYGVSRWNIEFDVHEVNKKSNKNHSTTADTHGLRIDLWTGNEIEKFPLRWQSKLLEKDLDIKQTDGKKEKQFVVSRASRLGRAAANASWETPISISFDPKHWNGRLQAPRKELKLISRRIETQKQDKKAISMRKKLKWFITFSPRLKPQGPWLNYVNDFKGKSPFTISENNKDKYEVGLHFSNNKGRKGSALHILSRLPELRILSLDLGHRHAAACAVWETLSSRQIENACAREGRNKPASDAMYLHVKSDSDKKKTIYRRIGSDKLPDGTAHPAPWARLERQFFIKLQGEEHDARMATVDEIWQVHKLEGIFGKSTPLIDSLIMRGWGHNDGASERLFEELKRLGRIPDETQVKAYTKDEAKTSSKSLLVDKLMFSAVKTIKTALDRHGYRAKIAYYLITTKKTEPGGIEVELNEKGRRDIIAKALALWYELAAGSTWEDPQALELWNSYIEPVLSTEESSSIADTASKEKRGKKKGKELEEKLKPVAEKLLGSHRTLSELSDLWSKRWKRDNRSLQKQLRRLRDWILPRGKKGKDKSIRNVGGLSLGRLGTIQTLYQVQKAYFTRFTPKGSQMDKKGRPLTASENFGRRILDDLENMRNQRVKQLASRVVEAALGVGRRDVPKKGKAAPKRPVVRVDAPCHAVVIEYLANYQPKETRARRENRRLMRWCAGRVKKYLSESCELHGLLLREVSPSYTSRQDSRTGAPGLRCTEMPAKRFLESSFWQGEIARAEKKNRKADAYEKYLLELKEKCKKEEDEMSLLRIPDKGGEIFISANSGSPASKGLQADLNAAANIGLRAIIDPDWPGRWWYVPCRDFRPVEDKVKGSKVFENISTLNPCNAEDSKAEGKKKQGSKKEIINLWRDPTCGSVIGGWKRYAEYWNEIKARVIHVIEGLSQ